MIVRHCNIRSDPFQCSAPCRMGSKASGSASLSADRASRSILPDNASKIHEDL